MTDRIPTTALAAVQAAAHDAHLDLPAVVADHVVNALEEQGWRIVREHPDEHIYFSTGCVHGEHDYCQKHTGLSGAKTPAVCKFCKAPCVCSCHAATVAR